MECKLTGDHRCHELCERLSEYIDRELAPSLCREIERHVAGCPACRCCLETLRQTVALCHRAGRHRIAAPLPRRLKARLRSLAKPPAAP